MYKCLLSIIVISIAGCSQYFGGKSHDYTTATTTSPLKASKMLNKSNRYNIPTLQNSWQEGVLEELLPPDYQE